MSDMPAPLDVDGERPAVAWVTSLPRSYKVTAEERNVLLVLACDSYDGVETSPGMESLARWSGLWRSSVQEIVKRLEKPTGYRPALIERHKAGRRTVFRLQVNVSGAAGHVTGPVPPDTSAPSIRPGARPAPPDTSNPNTSGRMSGATGHTLSLAKNKLASGPQTEPHDEPATPSVDDQLATVRADQLDALIGVMRDQPHGSKLTSASTWAQRLRTGGWTAEALAAVFAANPISGAATAGLLGARLAELVTTGPPSPASAASARPSRSTCPDHGDFTGKCTGCAGDHRAGDHRDQPSTACHLCTERRYRA